MENGGLTRAFSRARGHCYADQLVVPRRCIWFLLVVGCLSIGEMEAAYAVVLSQTNVVSVGLAGYEVWVIVFAWFTKGGRGGGFGLEMERGRGLGWLFSMMLFFTCAVGEK